MMNPMKNALNSLLVKTILFDHLSWSINSRAYQLYETQKFMSGHIIPKSTVMSDVSEISGMRSLRDKKEKITSALTLSRTLTTDSTPISCPLLPLTLARTNSTDKH